MRNAVPAGQSRPKLERKAIAAVVLGNAMEFYDFAIYAFFAKPIGEAFFPAKTPTDSLLASLALFGLGYVMRPIGGVVIGAYADRAGRKPAMILTIVLMALGMLILSVTPGAATIGHAAPALVILGRLIQGLALGGEVGPSTAFLLEAAPPERRGLVASWQIASQGLSSLAAGILASAMTLAFGDAAMDAWGWRVMLLLGIAVVPVGLVIRTHLTETASDDGGESSAIGVLRVLFRDHARLLGLTFVVIAAAAVSTSIGINMPVYAGSTLGLTQTVSAAVPIALGVASVVFPLVGGRLADRYGRHPLMVWPRALIAVLAIPAFYGLVKAPGATAVFAVTFALSALSSLNAAAIIVAVPEALPRAVRSAGLAIVYALAVSIFGGSTNYVVNKLIAITGDKLMPAYYLVAFSIAGTVAAWLMPETRGRHLEAET